MCTTRCSLVDLCSTLPFLSTLFERGSECKGVEPFCVRMWRDQPIISASNRYFTLQSSAPHEVLTTFPEDIDPKRLLNQFALTSNEPLVNLPENEVRYFARIPGSGVGQ